MKSRQDRRASVKKNKKNKASANSKKKQIRLSFLFFTFIKKSFFLLIIPASALLFIFIHDFFTQSACFKLRNLNIHGGQLLEREDILEILSDYKGEDILEDTNILALNTRHIRLLLEAHPWIRQARISRKLPDTLDIDIDEEEAFAVLKAQDIEKISFIANKDGRIFKEFEEEDPDNLAYIENIPLHSTEKREEYFLKAGELLDIITEKNKDFFLDERSRPLIKVDADLGFELSNSDIARRIFFGFSDFEKKSQRLIEILNYRAIKNPDSLIDTIDMIRADRIIIIPAQMEDMPGMTRREM